MDDLDRVRILVAEGHGDRHISGELGITRHEARNLIREVEKLSLVRQMDTVPVDRCRASAAARVVQTIQAEVLARSIEQLGLLQPIVVRQVGDGFEVIAGMHRLTAFRLLGREAIPAIIRTDDDLHAELVLIDENLIRNELTPAERSIAISRRKSIYQALHPETAHGGERAPSRQLGDLPPLAEVDGEAAERFSKATSQATGQSERSVQRDAHRGAIGEETLAKVVGTSLDKGEELDALARLSPEKRDEVIERAAAGEKVSAKIEVKKERRADREATLGSSIAALPVKKYGLIYADIPRHFKVHSDETGLGRSPENHFPTLSFLQTLDLPVASIAADDSICVFWSTAASLLDDIDILAEWGFATLRPRSNAGRLIRKDDGSLGDVPAGGRYCSMQVWDKIRIGLGYWFRDRHEFILIGVRGKVVPPAPGTQDESLFAEPKGEHSAKPERVAEMIERLWPNTPKIELFRRGVPRPGWDAWGNEAQPATRTDISATRVGPEESADVAPLTGVEPNVDAPEAVRAGTDYEDVPAFLRRDENNQSDLTRGGRP